MTAPSGSVPEPTEPRSSWPICASCGAFTSFQLQGPCFQSDDGAHGFRPTPPVPSPTESEENTVSDEDRCVRCGATQREVNRERSHMTGGPVIFAVACGCPGHGDHLGCEQGCHQFGCTATIGSARDIRCDHTTRDVTNPPPVADPVPAPTVDLDAIERQGGLPHLVTPREMRALFAELRAARAELSVLRAREAQVREVHRPVKVQHSCTGAHCLGCDEVWPCPTVAVLDGTTGSGKTG